MKNNMYHTLNCIICQIDASEASRPMVLVHGDNATNYTHMVLLML